MFKYCHSCGGEFQQWVETCPNCHEQLHAEPARASDAASRPAPPLDDLLLLKLGEPWELRELAQMLQAHGISSRIDRGEGTRLGIYVPRADLDAVREFAAQFGASEMPDGADAELALDPDACPACGEPTPANAASCSSCGLEFPEVEPDAGR